MNLILPRGIYQALLIVSVACLTNTVFCATYNNPQVEQAQAHLHTLHTAFEKIIKPQQPNLQQRALLLKKQAHSYQSGIISLMCCFTFGTLSQYQRFFQLKRSGNLLHPTPWYCSSKFFASLMLTTGLTAGYYIARYRTVKCNPLVQDQTLQKISALHALIEEIDVRVGDRIDILEQNMENKFRRQTSEIIFRTTAHIHHTISPQTMTPSQLTSAFSSKLRDIQPSPSPTASPAPPAQEEEASMFEAINSSLQELQKFMEPPSESKQNTTEEPDEDTSS